jgi:hypothetical protein
MSPGVEISLKVVPANYIVGEDGKQVRQMFSNEASNVLVRANYPQSCLRPHLINVSVVKLKKCFEISPPAFLT